MSRQPSCRSFWRRGAATRKVCFLLGQTIRQAGRPPVESRRLIAQALRQSPPLERWMTQAAEPAPSCGTPF
jgi:hypothetical protein